MNPSTTLERKLIEKALLTPNVEGDSLLLADGTLRAALDGSRVLTPNERAALRHSPLTLRRLRQLANDVRHQIGAWRTSSGMLRAAAGGAAPERIDTDDRCWSLHFVGHDGAWRIILKLEAEAPFAASLLRASPQLRVSDADGTTLLQGQLDDDGECEAAWSFAAAPQDYLQQHGARFVVELAGR